MRKQITLLLSVLAFGFTLGMLACWTQPGLVFQRIGMGLVMLAGTAAVIYGSTLMIDLALMAFKLHREFTAFLWQRARAKKESENG